VAQLAAAWPTARLIAIWNSLPGVTPVETFKTAKTGAANIWESIQSLAEATKPAAEPAKPKTNKKAKGCAKAAKGAPKAKKSVATEAKPKGIRGGSKTAQVVAILPRKNGATLAKIMYKMGWQKHSVRGFMAGAMKEAGYTVESFKPEGGERCYRI
jgi:hypothetical protein